MSPNRKDVHIVPIYLITETHTRTKKVYCFRNTRRLTKCENRENYKYFDFFITVPEFCTVVAVQLTWPETKEKNAVT